MLPHFDPLTRRDAGRLILAAAALPVGQLLAQPSRTPPAAPVPTGTKPPVKSILDGLMSEGRSRDWTLKVNVHVQAIEQRSDGKSIPQHIPIKFDTAAVVFPVLTGTSSSVMHVEEPGDVQSVLTFDDRPTDASMELKDGFDCGTRMGRWTLRNREGREMDLKVDLPMKCWETQFDEVAGMKIGWPASGKWGTVGQTCFRPQMGVDTGDQRVQGLVKELTNNKDPKSLSPVMLAKFLAGKIVEMIQVSGSGLAGSNSGLLQGVDLQGAARTILAKRGSPHDMACTLCAVYRAAGLPARLVIGLDVKERKGDDNFLGKGKNRIGLRSWVEFCLFDETADREVWVPVDPVRMRVRATRVGKLEDRWPYFGSHDELSDVLPFAHQYHPPAQGVIAHGSPSFWGWITTPRVQIAEQWIRFNSQMTPQRAPGRRTPGTR